MVILKRLTQKTMTWLCGRRASGNSSTWDAAPLSGKSCQEIPLLDDPPPYQAFEFSAQSCLSHPDPCRDFQDGKLSGWLRCDFIVPHGTTGVNTPFFRPRNLPWFAALCIVAKDLPALMEKGFYWDERNILKNEGSILKGPGNFHSTKGYSDIQFTRRYFLSDTGTDPQWMGTLEVYAYDRSTLARFQISELARENITNAFALNPRREDVWSYVSSRPEDDVNTIGQKLSMKGWWPSRHRSRA